ncbi:hypothetical protein [Pectobacterium phage PPWS2]|uniref:Uncharacterized protein n=1 Tax=Pectobacterium phage PPWS2 TaxID=2153295 RepID=A0A3G9E9P2_9CAUD|nr:hypothetical protein HOU58_gp08 [Pectobacterium phage PPWS2]BBD74640.1 hypothetical protein [Pectobacterium phage PPWS2]
MPYRNRAQRRADASEMRSKRKPSAAQKSLARPSRQNTITDGMIKLSTFWVLAAGIRLL